MCAELSFGCFFSVLVHVHFIASCFVRAECVDLVGALNTSFMYVLFALYWLLGEPI